jgi:GNAT superfamily N-acetyltransferase
MMMEIRYTNHLPARDPFYALFQTTGWNDNYGLTPDDLEKALQASWHLVCAYDGDTLVGFGRMLSDGVLHAMIYEMIVAPAYQGQGIGRQILKQLVAHCQAAGVRDIQLFCARGKRPFYEKNGFVARPDEAPGMQYRPAAGA